ncbi:MAG: aldo/keto reductase [Chloroflexota bacterium]|nr:aldo/keto reductase [Chloroflexota bacterium]
MIYSTLGRTGLQVYAIGFGAAPLGNEYGEVSAREAKRTVDYAIERGINIFDTSPYYGRTLSETRLGEALVGYRDKVLIATKAGRYDKGLPHGFDFSPARLTRSIEESLGRLKTDVIDVYQLHDIEFGNKEQILAEALPTLQKLKESGKVRFIGVTGFPLPLLRDVVRAFDVDAVLSYCHYNLMNTTLDDVLTPVVEEKGIGLMNASALHMGILTDQGAPAWHPAPPKVHEMGRRVARYCREQGSNITSLALQFAFQHPVVATTLVGMRNVAEVDHNLSLLGTGPDPDLLAEVQQMIEPVKDISWPSGHPEYYEPDVRSG